MTFLDASAHVAIIVREDDPRDLAACLDRATDVYTSPIAIFEAALGLARIGNVPPSEVMPVLEECLPEVGASISSIDAEPGRTAIAYGLGSHYQPCGAACQESILAQMQKVDARKARR